MNVILLHGYFDAAHLNAVKEEMRSLGAPRIRAAWADGWNAWVALEGSHRLRAAKELGLTPEIDPVPYADDTEISEATGYDVQDAITLSGIFAAVSRENRPVLSFEE